MVMTSKKTLQNKARYFKLIYFPPGGFILHKATKFSHSGLLYVLEELKLRTISRNVKTLKISTRGSNCNSHMKNPLLKLQFISFSSFRCLSIFVFALLCSFVFLFINQILNSLSPHIVYITIKKQKQKKLKELEAVQN